MTILCSQRDNRGQSICNAHEHFREQLQEFLKSNWRRKAAHIFRDNIESVGFGFRLLALSLLDVFYFKKGQEFGKDWQANSLWFEHWPADRTQSKKEEFWQVLYDDDSRPEFEKTSIEEIEDVTGYTEEQIRFQFAAS